MRAYGFTEYGDAEQQDFLELDTPEPGPAELQVTVHAAGVNPADAKIRSGLYADAMPLDLPVVLGREVSGVVTAVGGDAENFAVGDEVLGAVATGSGGFAEQTVLPAAGTVKKPPQVSFVDAAALPVAGATAYAAFRQLAVPVGGTLLLVGAGGGVGVVAAQLARDAGVTVVGVAAESKRELVESLGATLVSSGADVAGRVRQILPQGVDSILDLVGGDALRSVADLAPRGAVVSTADPSTAAEVGGSYVEGIGTSGDLAAIVGLVADGKLDPHVEDVRPFDEAAAALAAVETGHARGKVVIQVR